MFDFLKKSSAKQTEPKQLMSPMNGSSMPITSVADAVFSQKILGDGVAIVPTDGNVYAPCAGVIMQVSDTKHAIGIQGDESVNQAEVLLHIGMDTVELKGEGFSCHVKEGDVVKVGQLLLEVDLNLLSEKGYDLASPCVITNLSQDQTITCLEGPVQAGETPVISYQ